jgi:hypothetical protein
MNGHDVLLRIVSGIGENTWVKSTWDPIAAFNYDAVLVGLDKLVIEEYFPLCVGQFATAMGH